MTPAAAKQPDAPITKLSSRRHKWHGPVTIHRDMAPMGCEETERACDLCGLVKITVHPPAGFPYRAWRSKKGIRFPDPGYTPVCDGEVK